MKVLSIGNSFSQDAQRYLHRLAEQDGTQLKTVNLYIGGCSLERHYLNMQQDDAAYDLELNGEKTGQKTSIRQALASDTWDVITLQQASHYSGRYETYLPYIEALAQYVRQNCPRAKLLLHQTWAYEDDSQRLKALENFACSKEMLSAACDAYSRAAQQIKADGIIPCGEAMMRALDMGMKRVHRDTFHASLGAGRYLLALCWYKALTGRDISRNAFCDFDEEVTQAEREIVIQAADLTVISALGLLEIT